MSIGKFVAGTTLATPAIGGVSYVTYEQLTKEETAAATTTNGTENAEASPDGSGSTSRPLEVSDRQDSNEDSDDIQEPTDLSTQQQGKEVKELAATRGTEGGAENQKLSADPEGKSTLSEGDSGPTINLPS